MVEFRHMTLKNIVRNPAVCAGKATIKGTDFTVEFVLEQLAAGVSVQKIRGRHPSLAEGFILEAIAFAAQELKKQDENAELKTWTKEFIEEYRPALQALANE